DVTASRIPFLGAGAYKKVYRKSLSELWAEFKADASARAALTRSDARRLTHHGFSVRGPQIVSDDRLFYSIAGAHDFPALMEWTPAEPKTVTTRVLGTRVSSAGDDLVFDQVEFVRSVALLSDLYAVPRGGGKHRALTREARAVDPDVSADGRTIVCAVQMTGRRILATLPYTTRDATQVPVPLIDEPSTEFSSPRWSPDTHLIVAERRRLGGPSEIVVIDVASRVVRVLTASAHGRSVAPVWTPDGREIVFASDRDGGAFALYRIGLDGASLRKAVNLGNSAEAPALSRDGARLVFVGYTVDGSDLFDIPVAEVQWQAAAAGTVPSVSPLIAASGAQVSAYQPWRTLAPRFWFPVIEEDDDRLAFGAGTAGTDALGRHYYFTSASWSSRRRPDWNASYAYDRWLPTLLADVSDSTDPWKEGTVRVRELNAGAVVPFRHVRQGHALFGGFHAATEEFACASCAPPTDARLDRRAIRGGWQFSTARAYGYSISPEQGWRGSVSSEWTRKALGSDGDATSVIADVRGYVRTWPRHGALAGRVAFAAASGDERVRRAFSAAGSDAQPGGIGFSFDTIGLLRGFDSADVVGRRAAVINADYRFPLRWVERGVGTWPFFLRSLHGAVFADRGAAWDSTLRAEDWRTSAGAELSADVVLGYWVPVTFTSGVAWRKDPSGAVRGVTPFFRVGRAF
ncbi:MAG: PD40 domain-containing protein, partial [Acidobacteria bacterium]|nr:PD40 domain-containing protein [Acidobacteriota bacterium]